MTPTPVRNCRSCRFWSELIAGSMPETGHQFKAMCLNQESPRLQAYTAPHEICDQWKSGHLGAVDAPGCDVLTLYREEEKRT